MSQLDDLISRYCPAGVLVRRLGEVVEIRSGWGFPNADQGRLAGDYPFYKVSDMNLPGNEVAMTRANNYVDAAVASRLGVSPAPAGTVIFPKIGAAVATNKKRILTVASAYDNNVMGLVPSGDLDPRYLFYWTQTIELSAFSNDSGAVPSIRKSAMQTARIPVPPVAVQREIVRVLDDFAQCARELEIELEAELGARRRQYEHHREQLFAFDESGVRRAPMGELGTFVRGRRFTKSDLVVAGGIPSIHYGEIYTRYGVATHSTVSQVRHDLADQLRFAQPGDVVIAAVGETVEDVAKAVAWLGEEPVAIHDDTFLFRSQLNPKFVSYYLQTAEFHGQKNKHVARAKVKRLSGESLAKIGIPVPDADEQQRIVWTLDRFDALLKQLAVELRAEVKARRRQYEYYRDRLLTFKEAA